MPVFTANIPGSLKVGDRIEIGGKIKESARKMSINLCAQDGEEPKDVVLHFDVRFHRDNIISLSRKNGIWIGSGNYDTNYNMFVPGTIFRIVFEIKDTDVITIYCQGKFHSNFLPKIPLSMARYLVAWADVDRITHCFFYLCNKNVIGDGVPPSPGMAFQKLQTPAVATALAGDTKRCSRSHRKTLDKSARRLISDDSCSDEDTTKGRPKAEGRVDKHFYESLMCQPDKNLPAKKMGSVARMRSDNVQKYARSRRENEMSESEKISETDELESKIMASSTTDVDKKHRRRSKFPFSHVVNFMGRSSRHRH
ncbi:uncharacterized protein LOC105393924 isoform X2 [Plutella xylostella]|uniref:uncharacterized protein LOC105393924 isoform X2 n=1 Tax=Plutella xylostella TaxID=51655 RepID=UPI0020331192|nr:uncharacterized protein LOC105393924 isoform X2 [Plutella xylostella]